MTFVRTVTGLMIFAVISGCIPESDFTWNVSELRAVAFESAEQLVGEDKSLSILSEWVYSDLIAVTIDTNTDLKKLSMRENISFILDINFCTERDVPIILGLPYIYQQRENISNSIVSSSDHFDNSRKRSDNFTYVAVIFQGWVAERKVAGSDSKSEYYAKYDLVTHPKDICISLKGRKMAITKDYGEIRLGTSDIASLLRADLE